MILINHSKILFTSTLILGTIISISANSWPMMWMGLEMNLLSFIPIMLQKNNILTSEASLKYFLIQAMASSIFFISILLTYFLKEIMILSSTMTQFPILLSLFMKLGISPFHFWFPSVMEGLSWFNCFILMSWQKIAPFVIMFYLKFSFSIMSIFIILSIFTGSIGGLNQTSLRKLLTYSSINHLGWMLNAVILNQTLWLIYFLIYSFLSFILIFIFSNSSLSHFNQIIFKFQNKPILKLILMINLFSLGGLPPFLGFFPKWMIIQLMSYESMLFMNFLLISSALITLYFYIQISISSFLILSTQSKWTIKPSTSSLLILLSSISLIGLFIYPLLLFI